MKLKFILLFISLFAIFSCSTNSNITIEDHSKQHLQLYSNASIDEYFQYIQNKIQYTENGFIYGNKKYEGELSQSEVKELFTLLFIDVKKAYEKIFHISKNIQLKKMEEENDGLIGAVSEYSDIVYINYNKTSSQLFKKYDFYHDRFFKEMSDYTPYLSPEQLKLYNKIVSYFPNKDVKYQSKDFLIFANFVMAHELGHLFYDDKMNTVSIPSYIKNIELYDYYTFSTLSDNEFEFRSDFLSLLYLRSVYPKDVFDNFLSKLTISRMEDSIYSVVDYADSYYMYNFYNNAQYYLNKYTFSGLQHKDTYRDFRVDLEKIMLKSLTDLGLSYNKKHQNKYTDTSLNKLHVVFAYNTIKGMKSKYIFCNENYTSYIREKCYKSKNLDKNIDYSEEGLENIANKIISFLNENKVIVFKY